MNICLYDTDEDIVLSICIAMIHNLIIAFIVLACNISPDRHLNKLCSGAHGQIKVSCGSLYLIIFFAAS